MNLELKALLSVLFDALQLVLDAVAKKNFVAMLPDVYKVIVDLPGAVSNLADIQAEIAALPGSAQEADLIAFIESRFAGVVGSNVKAQAILAASLSLIQDGSKDVLALIAAIKS